MKRARVGASAASLALLAVLCGCGQQPHNLVLITVDTTRADHLGCYGNPLGLTPHLDALAARGVLFENAYAPIPQTLPTHATLFSGLDPRLHGALENSHVLPDAIETLAEVFRAAGFQTGAFIGAQVLSPWTGIHQGFDVFDEPAQGKQRANERTVSRPARRVTDAALGWADTLTVDGSFLLWAHYYDPHDPHKAPKAAKRRVDRAEVLAWQRARPREIRHGARVSRKDVIDYWHGYATEIRGMDEEIGRLLEELEVRRLMQGTTVVVVGDHGEGLYEHGLRGHGLRLYEEQVRIPFLIARPDERRPGHRVTTPVTAADVMPTMLDVVLRQPTQRVLTGRSLAPLLDGDGVIDERPVFVERPHYSRKRLRQRAGRFAGTHFRYGTSAGLIEGGFKLIREPGSADVLYDLGQDPEEIQDLARSEPEKLAALAVRLDEWLAEHPVADPGTERVVNPEQLEALRALGYLGEDE